MWELIQWGLWFLLLMVLCVWAIHVLLRAEEREQRRRGVRRRNTRAEERDRREEANNDHEE